jgi:hypothetical protein
MTGGRFGAMVGALVWRQSDGKYLLLQSAVRPVPNDAVKHALGFGKERARWPCC